MNDDRQHENDHNDAASAGSESPEEGQAAMQDAEDAVEGGDADGDSR
ncbi:MAG: hypothetical protein J0H70_03775 [Microbacterium chocolatum]|nr:hypothetical protein [Microbacterium chocolatum]